MDKIDDRAISNIFAYLPDAQTVCRLGAVSKQFRKVFLETEGDGDDDAINIWKALLNKIPIVGRPVKETENEEPPYTAKEVVLRFASASLFAERMEKLAEDHRRNDTGRCSSDDEKMQCPFPDCTAYCDDNAQAKGGCDLFFVRMKVSGKLLWHGFLESYMSSNGDIYLGNDNQDLSKEFHWPAMNQYLSMAPPESARLPGEGYCEWQLQ